MKRLNVATLLLACGGIGCGGDAAGPAARTRTVQIADFSTNVTTISCGLAGVFPDSVYWNIHMINTTDDTVHVTTVGTTGLVMSALSPNNVEGAQSVVGRPEFNFTSLPFNPSPTVLAAQTGDVTLTVSMPVSYAQDCAPDPLIRHGIIGMDDSFRKDVGVTLVVTTTAGQYTTVPSTLRVIHDFLR